MGRAIVANYLVSDSFKIPKNIPLLSVNENSKINTLDKIPYSWWVRYGTLYYYNDKKKVCRIECYSNYEDKKHPQSYESDDNEYYDSEEESDETEDETEDSKDE